MDQRWGCIHVKLLHNGTILIWPYSPVPQSNFEGERITGKLTLISRLAYVRAMPARLSFGVGRQQRRSGQRTRSIDRRRVRTGKRTWMRVFRVFGKELHQYRNPILWNCKAATPPAAITGTSSSPSPECPWRRSIFQQHFIENQEGRYHTKPGKGLRKAIFGLVAETSPLGWDLYVSLSKPPDLLFQCTLWYLESNKSARRISYDFVEFSMNNQLSTLPHSPFSVSLGYLSTSLFVAPSLDQAHSFERIK